MGEHVKTTATKTHEATPKNFTAQQKKTEISQQNFFFADRVLLLQKTIGNQAVQRLITSGKLQAKFRISQPGDKYEREADQIADQVIRMPESSIQATPT